jgi:hypothetical protein
MSSKQGTSASTGSGSGPGGQDRGQNVTHRDVAKEQRKQRTLRKEKQIKEGQALVAKNIESDRRKYHGKTKKYLIGGKKDVGEMYGGKASQMTNEYLVSIGEAKRGNPYYDHKGKITGYSYLLTSTGKEMKYGKSQGAMGSGDPTGIMTGTPISQQMYESQKQVQSLMKLGPMGLLSSAATDDKGYDAYLTKFYGGMSSAGIAARKDSKFTSMDTSETGQGESVIDPNERDASGGQLVKKKKKSFAGGGADMMDDARTLLATSKRTFGGTMQNVG